MPNTYLQFAVEDAAYGKKIMAGGPWGNDGKLGLVSILDEYLSVFMF